MLLLSCGQESPKQDSTVGDNDTISNTVDLDTFLEKTTLIPAYQDWSHYYNNKSKDLFVDSFIRHDESNGDFYTRPLSAQEMNRKQMYKRLFVYNSDSTRYIDIFSYAYIISAGKGDTLEARRGEPDQEVSVVNIKTRKQTRILFCGPSCYIQKAFWYNDDIIGLLGVSAAQNADHYEPSIWFVNLSSAVTMEYGYDKDITDAPERYIKIEMEKKGINLVD